MPKLFQTPGGESIRKPNRHKPSANFQRKTKLQTSKNHGGDFRGLECKVGNFSGVWSLEVGSLRLTRNPLPVHTLHAGVNRQCPLVLDQHGAHHAGIIRVAEAQHAVG